VPTRGSTDQGLRLADLLAALSMTTDLGMAHPVGEAMRTCLVAVDITRALGLPEPEVADVYYTALLRHLGCTATAHEESRFFGGDELATRPVAERTDFRNPREVVGMMLATGRGRGPIGRPKALLRSMAVGKRQQHEILTAVCEVAARMASRLGMPAAVRDSLYQSLERWDGKGSPRGVGGDALLMPARIAEVAVQAAIYDRLAGPDTSLEFIDRRSGSWLDPEVAEAFARVGPDTLARLRDGDVWQMVLDAEPAPQRRIAAGEIDDVAAAFADMVDLKSPFTLGHSTGVAALAEDAARGLGMAGKQVAAVRRAALFHDLGRVAVSAGVWERPGPLTHAEREQVRLHPYHSERILARSEALSPLARIAGMHHERQDGTGYHHGASGSEIPRSARILAAADAYEALVKDRPHRMAVAPGVAAKQLVAEAEEGRLDMECLRAVLAAAGETVAPRTSWPVGLSDREVDVLRLLALGFSNRDIGRQLFISPRTAEHHVQSIYSKIGMSTRAGAAMFAMEHDLIPR
jgi:HD-GYP domain-containing protein (c-di-GMP phosphodiesterase class II)/DNA-binding CsgD family transcriptional regulator